MGLNQMITGYGICDRVIKETTCAERIAALLQQAPAYCKYVEGCLADDGIETPTVDDYMRISDRNQLYGLAEMLREVICENEGVELDVFIDGDNGLRYLLYIPKYPWRTPEREKGLTENGFIAILKKYAVLLTDCEIPIEKYTICG